MEGEWPDNVMLAVLGRAGGCKVGEVEGRRSAVDSVALAYSRVLGLAGDLLWCQLCYKQ